MDTEAFAACMIAWLIKLCDDSILSKLNPDKQKVVKEIVQREGVPMYLEEAEIKDASKIGINQLIDTKELEIRHIEEKSIGIDNVSIVSFSDQSWFSTNSEW